MAIENWRKPDDGIWKARNGSYHFVYSKVMCWVALDRGIAIARKFRLDAPIERWARECEEIKNEVLRRGFSQQLNAFVQHFDTEIPDASLLIMPLVDFLPVTDPRIQGTIEACRTHLMDNGFVKRYRADDGLEGDEGRFLLCNFWIIECLALSGKIAEGEKLLGITMAAANDLGLFSEEYDPYSKEMLGNSPQAFSHIGYINATATLIDSKLPHPRIRKAETGRHPQLNCPLNFETDLVRKSSYR
ncbi:glycoside hydrolase family 15 protein [Chlorobaculum sp. MV4-Y]|jgi:GH15 family glucan-1,4-alpha-glucosidase|uniref:glycoside hydrolase family 15 protein n=1 Tax=Chlorobaculum sp. MV4-Y TaxID=2976335 RepID=UPI0021AEDDF3|nr:glycoside hydrolase family 15 protein [Chlorobaculum sp. MV4-Y]UWX58271.1 glycoside hydrolase family 15 protein [Chlorobaculum sp. MV4-Y]